MSMYNVSKHIVTLLPTQVDRIKRYGNKHCDFITGRTMQMVEIQQFKAVPMQEQTNCPLSL